MHHLKVKSVQQNSVLPILLRILYVGKVDDYPGAGRGLSRHNSGVDVAVVPFLTTRRHAGHAEGGLILARCIPRRAVQLCQQGTRVNDSLGKRQSFEENFKGIVAIRMTFDTRYHHCK